MPFRHEALLYAGDDEFLAAAVPFVRDGLDAGEAVMAALPRPRLERLGAQLGARADDVALVDMAVAGANPARIIPAWAAFVAEHADVPLRGLGEPIWPGREGAELAECQLHESLLNVAFAAAPSFWLKCPYDTASLDPAVIADACAGHPFHPVDAAHALDGTLPAPTGAVRVRRFADGTELAGLRGFVRGQADGLDADQLDGLLIAVTEAATNSLRHGGGRGSLRVWREDGRLICEIRDAGRIADPLAGRRRPDGRMTGGWGLWIANEVCDLVQLRTAANGTTVRLHMRTG